MHYTHSNVMCGRHAQRVLPKLLVGGCNQPHGAPAAGSYPVSSPLPFGATKDASLSKQLEMTTGSMRLVVHSTASSAAMVMRPQNVPSRGEVITSYDRFKVVQNLAATRKLIILGDDSWIVFHCSFL